MLVGETSMSVSLFLGPLSLRLLTRAGDTA
jgi:hypothetical protein